MPELEALLMYYRPLLGEWLPAHEPSEPEPVAIDATEVSARDLRWQRAEF